MSKLTTDVLLKESIKSILTELVNSTFEWQEYTDSEISDILEISDEQALELSKIINDNVKANNKLWSSNKIDSELQNMIIEANKYSDELIGQISSISLEYVTVLPDTDIKSNVIYILQGNPNTLNVYNNSTSAFVTVGDLNIDLTNYYTKSEVDAELAKKANNDEVLKPDAIVADLTTTSGSTTLSTAGLQTELDKVVKTADIKTTLDENSTNDDVYGGKAIFDAIHESISMILSSASDITTLLAKLKSLAPGKSAVIKLFDDSGILFPVTGNYIGTVSVINGNEIIVICVNHWNSKHAYTFRVQNDDTSISLNKICTTSVADSSGTGVITPAGTTGVVKYKVINGICYVEVSNLAQGITGLSVCSITGLPKTDVYIDKLLDLGGVCVGSIYCNAGQSTFTAHKASASGGYGSFSYPVAES